MLLRAAPFAKRAMLSSKRPPPLQQGIVVFPDVLHHVLTVLEQDNQSHIASWLPHGRSFKVHDRKAFVETILPWYVDHFVRAAIHT